MADQKKEGLLSRLFGTKKSSCCSLKIEEIVKNDKPLEAPEPSKKSACCGPCCGEAPAKQDEK